MNVLLVSHGALCEGVYDAYKMLIGAADNISTLSLTVEGGVEKFRAELNEKFDSLVREGVLVLTDLKGGTPCNESFARFLQDPEHIRIACGLNLPMLIEVGMESADATSLDELLQTALAAGGAGVCAGDPAMDDADEDEDDLF